MIQKSATIQNASGFHIRPAQLFTEKASAFQSSILVITAQTQVDGKSILGLMTLGLEKGATVTIQAEGTDEEAAVNELAALVESGFGEA